MKSSMLTQLLSSSPSLTLPFANYNSENKSILSSSISNKILISTKLKLAEYKLEASHTSLHRQLSKSNKLLKINKKNKSKITISLLLEEVNKDSQTFGQVKDL